jgi:hypothetical protein
MKSKVELTTRKGAWICLSDNRWINCQTISEFKIHHVNGDSTGRREMFRVTLNLMLVALLTKPA